MTIFESALQLLDPFDKLKVQLKLHYSKHPLTCKMEWTQNDVHAFCDFYGHRMATHMPRLV